MSSIDGIGGAIATEHVEYEQIGGAGAAEQSGDGFSNILADSIRDEMARAAAMAGVGTTGMPGGYLPTQMYGQGLEEMILSAASSGEIDDAQMALFMLCMMMQSSPDGDFSMLMQMMATMITQLQGDSGPLRGSIMSSGYDPNILDAIDWNVFGTAFPGTIGAGGAVLPLEFWRPASPVTTSHEDNRSAERYRSVIAQFRVETAERYRPFRDGYTYCNIFVWDVTSAMGAELPHYTDPATGEPLYYPNTSGAKAMTAIENDRWLKAHGEEYGWRQVDAETAQLYANSGRPAVVSGGSMDHIQVVCPSRNGGYDPVRGVTIAQAGRIVTSYTHITDVYSANSINNHITYWVHD